MAASTIWWISTREACPPEWIIAIQKESFENTAPYCWRIWTLASRWSCSQFKFLFRTTPPGHSPWQSPTNQTINSCRACSSATRRAHLGFIITQQDSAHHRIKESCLHCHPCLRDLLSHDCQAPQSAHGSITCWTSDSWHSVPTSWHRLCWSCTTTCGTCAQTYLRKGLHWSLRVFHNQSCSPRVDIWPHLDLFHSVSKKIHRSPWQASHHLERPWVQLCWCPSVPVAPLSWLPLCPSHPSVLVTLPSWLPVRPVQPEWNTPTRTGNLLARIRKEQVKGWTLSFALFSHRQNRFMHASIFPTYVYSLVLIPRILTRL